MKRVVKRNPVSIDRSMNDNFYRQNPVLMNTHTIPCVITRYFTDVNGTIVDKALVPAPLQTRYPVILFGQFDRNGGYRKSLQVLPPVAAVPGYKYLMTYTNGVNQPFLSFTGVNNIKEQIGIGDLVLVYTDDITNPNYFVFIVITSESTSLASVVANTESTQQDGRLGILDLKEINYYGSDRKQFDEPLFFTKFDNIGNYRTDSINPSMTLDPFVQQPAFLTIPTPFRIDQYMSIVFYMIFDVDKISLDFIVNKL